MEQRRIRSFCRLCPAHCGIVATVEGEQVTKIEGDPQDPISHGYTCPKGRMLGRLHHHPRRLDYPMLRRDDELVRVEWDELLDDLAARLSRVRAEHGNDALAVYAGTAGAFDAPTRLGIQPLWAALETRSRYTPITVDCPGKLLVSDLIAGSTGLIPIPDYDTVEMLLYVADNPVVSHGSYHFISDPVVHVREIARRGEVWVLDVRRTETARLATRHLAARPATDYAVLAFLVRGILDEGADHEYLAAHAIGVDELRAAVEPFTVERAAQITGLEATALDELLAAVRRHGRLAIQTGTGISMSANANVIEWLAWALHIVTGSLERPGGSWFNPGYLTQGPPPLPKAKPPEPGPPSRPDLHRRWDQYPATALADEIDAGNVRAMLVVGGSPATSFPDAARMRATLSSLDVLAVWDVVESPMSELATHVLPSLDGLERADFNYLTATGLECVAAMYTPAVVAPKVEHRPAWWSALQVGRRMGLEGLPDLALDTATDDDVIASAFGRGRISFDDLRAADGPVVFGGAEHGWALEHVVPDGRWNVAPVELVAQLRDCREPAPLVLTPRRQVRHVNSTLIDDGETQFVAVQADISPKDAAAAGIADGDRVRVTSSYGSLELTANVTDLMMPGAVSIPHGYGHVNVSALTSGTESIDPLTGMVTQSGLPIEIELVS